MRKTNSNREVVVVNLDDVYIPEKTMERILRRDRHQVERMIADYENDCDMVRVVLRPRFGGGYNVEDGRHRVIAAKFAEVGFIEAIIIGDVE
jgi:hypothetical protein